MKLGLFMMPVHPPEKDRTQCFEEDIELIVHADELGFTEAWIGQHCTLAWEPIPSNDVFIANVLPRTKNIRLGSGVTLIPHHHPANVALRLALLDHLSRGRINCAFGQSGVPTDQELFDLPDPKTQGLMCVEGLDMVLKLWETEAPFDLKGDYWHIKVESTKPDLEFGMLKPYQKPHPPIAMSVVKGSSMAARMAGERGYIPISTNLVAGNTVKEHWQTYCSGAEEAGCSQPDREIWRVARSIFIGETSSEAWDYALNSPFADSFTYMLSLLRSADMVHLVKRDPELPDSDVTTEYLLRESCIVGDKNECMLQISKLWDETGGFGTLLMVAHDMDDKPKWRQSMAWLANEVVPSFPSL